MDTEIVVLNGRAGTDRDKRALTFVSCTEKRQIGQNWGSTIDLVCISASHDVISAHFVIEDVEQKGKHAVVWVVLTFDVFYERFYRENKKKDTLQA